MKIMKFTPLLSFLLQKKCIDRCLEEHKPSKPPPPPTEPGRVADERNDPRCPRPSFRPNLVSLVSLLPNYRRIPRVTAPVTFGFRRQKGPLLSGSRYFQIVKKRLYGALIHSLFRYKRTHNTTSYPHKIKQTVYNKEGPKC